MNTKDIEEIDLAIANLLFAGLSLEQMKKIPKWLLENVENNKPNFRDTLTQYHEAEVERKDDLLDDMWGLICNVNGGFVENEKPEWYEAFKRIRAKYLAPNKTDKQTEI